MKDFKEMLKERDKIDMDEMIKILHNCPISLSYSYECTITVKEPSYTISQNDMVKLLNYVLRVEKDK